MTDEELKEKQKPAKPFENLSIFGGIEYDCRWCGNEVKRTNTFCPCCGQRQDWGDLRKE